MLVLIPGGTYVIGSQSTDEHAAHYDPTARPFEAGANGRPVSVSLDPFFLSKHEMTQGQWLRFTNTNPSAIGPHRWSREWGAEGRGGDLTHPVEQVSWNRCMETLTRLGLTLPTEAQWEAACRALTSTPWWTGADLKHLDQAANLADLYCKQNGGVPDWQFEEALDDGFATHAPVGSYATNAFGLHDTIGNVWEWCRDGRGSYALPVASGDGERLVPNPTHRIFRGGCYGSAPFYARSSHRDGYAPAYQDSHIGCRPARFVD